MADPAAAPGPDYGPDPGSDPADGCIVGRATKGDAPSVAIYSPCRRYRYSLTRVWNEAGARVLFVMLNPSTATEQQNDPSVERCERRARTLGFGAFRVCNIFAYRQTDPRLMRAEAAPVGPLNDAAIAAGCRWADRAQDAVICAWGTHGAHLGRGAAAIALIRGTGTVPSHLGLSKAGHPRHPLYLPYAQAPVPWP